MTSDSAAAPDPVEGRWARAVLRFNLEPAEYADPSWLPGWAPHATPRVRRALSHGLLCEHGLEALFDWSLDAPAARLFMMDPAARQPIDLAIGIAAYRDSLRQVVRKDRLVALRECLGEPLSALWLGVAETVPRSAVPLALEWASFDAPALSQALADRGRLELSHLLDAAVPAQRAAAARVAFCLPRRHAETPEGAAPALSSAQAARMTDAIVTDLLPRWAPQWIWLF